MFIICYIYNMRFQMETQWIGNNKNLAISKTSLKFLKIYYQ